MLPQIGKSQRTCPFILDTTSTSTNKTIQHNEIQLANLKIRAETSTRTILHALPIEITISSNTELCQATKQLHHTAYYHKTGIFKRSNNIANYFYLAKLRNNFRKRIQNPKSISKRSTSTSSRIQNTQWHLQANHRTISAQNITITTSIR